MGKGGSFTLGVDGKTVASGKVDRTVPARFSVDETLDIGEDTGTPIVEDYAQKMPFRFTGAIKKVVIELDASKLTASDRQQIQEMEKKGCHWN